MPVLPEAARPPGAVPDPRRPPLSGRQVQGAGEAQQAVAAGRQGRLLGRGRGGIGRSQVDEPGHGVRPEEGRLGALEDLGLVEVVHQAGHAEAAQVDVVHDEPHGEAGRPLTGVVAALADAPDLEVARPRGAAGPVEIGDGRDQLVQVIAAGTGHAAPVEDGHRGGDLRQDLLDQPAGDHDFGHGQGHRTEPHRERRRFLPGAQDHRLVPDMADDGRVTRGQGQLEAAVAVRRDHDLSGGQMGARQGPACRRVDDGAADRLRRGGGSREEDGKRHRGGERGSRVGHNGKGRFLQVGKNGRQGACPFSYAGMIQVRFEGSLISGRSTGHPQRMSSLKVGEEARESSEGETPRRRRAGGDQVLDLASVEAGPGVRQHM